MARHDHKSRAAAAFRRTREYREANPDPEADALRRENAELRARLEANQPKAPDAFDMTPAQWAQERQRLGIGPGPAYPSEDFARPPEHYDPPKPPKPDPVDGVEAMTDREFANYILRLGRGDAGTTSDMSKLSGERFAKVLNAQGAGYVPHGPML